MEEHQMNKFISVLCVLIIICSSQLAYGSIVYSNPYSSSSTNAYQSWHNTVTGTLRHQVFTDFYWDGTYSITDFHFWGTNVYNPTAVEKFTFQVYTNDDINMPGDLVYEEVIPGNGGATFVETNPNYGLDVYKYGFDLGAAFNPVNAGYYWFSVYGHNTDGLEWYWAQGDGQVGNPDWQHFLMNHPVEDDIWRNTGENDFAFEISTDTIIPEPGTLALLSLGLIGLAFRRKKK
jgi:PEP-CTERM motif